MNYLRMCLVFMVSTLAMGASAMAEKFAVKAVAQNSSPKYILTSEQSSGICMDVYRAMGETLADQGVQIELPTSTTPIKRIYADLESGAAHIYCGSGKTKKRETKFDFSQRPIYPVANILVKRRSNPLEPEEFGDLADGNTVVGALFGSSSTRYLAKNLEPFERARINDAFRTIDHALNAVEKGVVDYFYYHDLGILYNLLVQDRPLVAVKHKFREYGHFMAYSRSLPRSVQQKLEAALEKLHADGTINRIFSSYRVS